METKWIKVTERMPAETKWESDTLQGHREWTESERVLVVTANEDYFVDSTYNGAFRSERHKDCDGFVHYVIAWMPITKYDFKEN